MCERDLEIEQLSVAVRELTADLNRIATRWHKAETAREQVWKQFNSLHFQSRNQSRNQSHARPNHNWTLAANNIVANENVRGCCRSHSEDLKLVNGEGVAVGARQIERKLLDLVGVAPRRVAGAKDAAEQTQIVVFAKVWTAMVGVEHCEATAPQHFEVSAYGIFLTSNMRRARRTAALTRS